MNICKKTLFNSAIEKWGVKTQASMAMGECGELTAELNKLFIQERMGHRDNVIEEIADVAIMCEQIIHMLGAEEELEKVKLKKLERLSGIINGNIYHPHNEVHHGES
ncbi:hypothetical protein [Pseudoalteromonas sp. Of7M-16]|uniref:hypothetical protein n=1 Tax=Pseudoalteromonas sp. Of7M-16 TaxID=2917756 RepID=UPI001EF4C2A0|nr:hypothetical protein [Pseudoalteromonas sp. Of7M-16]MCG7549235.1 hypothetical protein [Pseudoalteromonas sp. Of7M-16]